MRNEAINRDLINESVETSLPQIGYSIREAQKITGLGRTTLWKAIEEGRLKCFKVGRRRIFSLSHLEEFLKLYESDGEAALPKRRAKGLHK
jgi:excisionase family DNA binding protein